VAWQFGRGVRQTGCDAQPGASENVPYSKRFCVRAFFDINGSLGAPSARLVGPPHALPVRGVRSPPSPPSNSDDAEVLYFQAFLEPPIFDGGAPRWSTWWGTAVRSRCHHSGVRGSRILETVAAIAQAGGMDDDDRILDREPGESDEDCPLIGRVRICAGGGQQWPSLPRYAEQALKGQCAGRPDNPLGED
jgi:hypothetical protein